MSAFKKWFSPRVGQAVDKVATAKFELPLTNDSKADPEVRIAAEEAQLSELQRLGEVLEAGSTSLNQRATTLAGLAVAGIGTFGLFAGRLAGVHGADARRIVAIALVVASVSLAAGAAFALRAVVPGGKWAEQFAKVAQPLIEGDLRCRGKAWAAMVQMQLTRNSEKAVWMKWAYRSTAISLLAIVVAVVTAAHTATTIFT